jgi:hypothetical protein
LLGLWDLQTIEILRDLIFGENCSDLLGHV